MQHTFTPAQHQSCLKYPRNKVSRRVLIFHVPPIYTNKESFCVHLDNCFTLIIASLFSHKMTIFSFQNIRRYTNPNRLPCFLSIFSENLLNSSPRYSNNHTLAIQLSSTFVCFQTRDPVIIQNPTLQNTTKHNSPRSTPALANTR